MNTIIVYHGADADGWMSRAICENEAVKLSKSEDCFRSIGWDFGQPYPDLSNEDVRKARLIVVDLPPDPVYEVIPFAAEFVWIDHHKSAIEANASIPYQGLRHVGLSACRLTWAFFNLPYDTDLTQYETKPMPGEPELVFLIGLRDVWKHKGTEWQDVCQNINLALVSDRTFPFREAIRMPKSEHQMCVDSLEKRGHLLSQYSKSMNREMADRGAFMKQMWGMKVLILNSQLRGSEILEPAAFDLQRSGESVDALCVFCLNRYGKFNFSLYHAPGQKHRDLTQIVKLYGGGGHPGACGFEANWDIVRGLLG